MSSFEGCIVLGNFFDSFSFYGIKTILFLFLFSKMDYTKDESTFLFHIFLILVGTFPLFGIFIIKHLQRKLAITAGLCFFYTIGYILLVLGLLRPIEVPYMQIQVPVWVSIFSGLVFIAICSGGIRVSLFAAGFEQFKLLEQEKQFRIFLKRSSIYCFVGAALSTAIAPVLRDDFHCYDDYGCFPLAFAPFGIIMILATLVFIERASQYVVKPRPDVSPQQHSNKKIYFLILLLFLILSFFWALFEQQGSRWTLQATRMDGELWGYNIKPDQMQLSYYLLSLILVPLIYYIIHPILDRIGIKSPLIKIFFGGLLAAAAFFLAASLEVDLEKLDPVLPSSETAQFRVYNGMHCDYSVSQIIRSNSTETVKVEPLGYYEAKDLQKCNVSFQAVNEIHAKSNEFSCFKENIIKAIELGKAVSFFIRQDFIQSYEAHVDKPKLGTPIVRPLINVPQTVGNLTLKDSANLTNLLGPNSTRAIIVTRGEVSLLLNEKPLTTFVARSGCVYVLLGHRNEKQINQYEFRTYNTVEPNTVHMMWQLPQYICITAGEIMVTKNAFEFTFYEAPAILHAIWWIMMAVGNLLAVIIMKLKFYEAQSEEYRLFACIMLIDMIVFTVLAMCYKVLKPVDVEPPSVPEIEDQRKSKSSHSESHHSSKHKSRPSETPQTSHSSRSNRKKLKRSSSVSSIPEQIKSSLHRTSRSEPKHQRTRKRKKRSESMSNPIPISSNTPSSKSSSRARSHSRPKESSGQLKSSKTVYPPTSHSPRSARRKSRRSSSISSTPARIKSSSHLTSRSEPQPHQTREKEKNSQSTSNPNTKRKSNHRSSNFDPTTTSIPRSSNTPSPPSSRSEPKLHHTSKREKNTPSSSNPNSGRKSNARSSNTPSPPSSRSEPKPHQTSKREKNTPSSSNPNPGRKSNARSSHTPSPPSSHSEPKPHQTSKREKNTPSSSNQNTARKSNARSSDTPSPPSSRSEPKPHQTSKREKNTPSSSNPNPGRKSNARSSHTPSPPSSHSEPKPHQTSKREKNTPSSSNQNTARKSNARSSDTPSPLSSRSEPKSHQIPEEEKSTPSSSTPNKTRKSTARSSNFDPTTTSIPRSSNTLSPPSSRSEPKPHQTSKRKSISRPSNTHASESSRARSHSRPKES